MAATDQTGTWIGISVALMIVPAAVAIVSGMLLWSEPGQQLVQDDNSTWSEPVVQDLSLPAFAIGVVTTGALLVDLLVRLAPRYWREQRDR